MQIVVVRGERTRVTNERRQIKSLVPRVQATLAGGELLGTGVPRLPVKHVGAVVVRAVGGLAHV